MRNKFVLVVGEVGGGGGGVKGRRRWRRGLSIGKEEARKVERSNQVGLIGLSSSATLLPPSHRVTQAVSGVLQMDGLQLHRQKQK